MRVPKNSSRVYRFDDHESYDRWDLEHSGYHYVNWMDFKGEKQSYYFRPFFHETARHGILVFELADYLKRVHRLNVKTYLSRKPDIVFESGGEKWAIEVETGVIFRKNKQQFIDKVETLKYIYKKRWFFVITDRNMLKTYRRYGKTFTKRNVLKKIDKIIEANYDD